MKKIIFLIPVVCIALLCTQGCYYDKADLLYPSTCDTSNVTYSQTVKPVISSYCLSCHGNTVFETLGGSIDLDGYSNLVGQVQNGKLLPCIRHDIGADPMPKNEQQLSDCNISKIEIWINNGAPNN